MPNSKLTFARVAQMIRPKAGCRLLFVYDNLMDADVMAERVPDPEFICTARMESRRFLVNTDGIGSITPRIGFEVHGVIWQVEEIGVTGLNLQLGVPGRRGPIRRVQPEPRRHADRERILHDSEQRTWDRSP